MDDVDKIITQWNKERPELDVAPMALIGRTIRVSNHLAKGMEVTFSKFGLNAASFDVLATLRRSGEPFSLSPTDLMNTMMITSGTMTNRIDQLAKKGFVERISNPEDGRSFLINLTSEGRALVDQVVSEHVKTQASLVSGLNESEREQLNQLLSKFMTNLEEKAAG